MRKDSEFKISLSNPRVEKILNSTTGDRESVSGEGGEEGCIKCGGVKFRSMVKLWVHGIHVAVLNTVE